MNTLALRLAVGDGQVDGIPVRALVSAGFTLLPRCAPLVLALGTRRAGLLLPPGAAMVAALAACDGRGAVWFDPAALEGPEGGSAARPAIDSNTARSADGRVAPGSNPDRLGIGTASLERFGIAAVFTMATLADRVPAGVPVVLLDDVPARATLRRADGRRGDIDLGTHFGLAIEGSTDEPGRDEECLVLADADATLTHHEVLSGDPRLPDDLRGLLTPLLRGAHLATVITP